MSTDEDDESHDRLVIDDHIEDASMQSTPRKANRNFANFKALDDVDMEEGELDESTETLFQSPVSSKSKTNESKKKQIAIDGDIAKTVLSSASISTKDKSAAGTGTKGNDIDNGNHQLDQKSTENSQTAKQVWKKSVSPSSDPIYSKKGSSTTEESSSSLNFALNSKRSTKQELGDCEEEVVSRKPEKGEKSAASKQSNLNSGVKNFLSPQPPASKKKKMVDKSTCVLTKACQMEDGLLSLKPGSTVCLNVTVVCKAGANTLYVLAKWKGKDYHGVLTDGEPVHSHLYAQKRGDKNSDHATALPSCATPAHNSDKTGVSSAGKVRGKRGANRQTAGSTDKKSRHTDDAAENNCQGSEPNSSNTKSNQEEGNLPCSAKSLYNKQYELASDKSFVRRCPHKQCGYRFESMGEVNTHLVMAHADSRATMCEAIATQTDPIENRSTGTQACESQRISSVCAKCQVSTEQTCPSTAVQKKTEEESLHDLFKVIRPGFEKKLGGESVTKSSTSPGAFSDISDDGAPMLEKEENFESNKAGMEKKVAVNEPIQIIPPENTGPTLDILSPVLSTTKPSIEDELQKPYHPTVSAAPSVPLASPLIAKRPAESCTAQSPSYLSPTPSAKSSLVQPEGPMAVQQTSNTGVPLPLASSGANPPAPHIYMNQMAINPFQAAGFLNPTAFYSNPHLAAQLAAVAAAGQTSVNPNANSRLVSPSLQQHPSSFLPVNGGGMVSSPLGPSASGASGCLSTGKSDASIQLQRHKLYELKQLQQQQQQPSTSSLGLHCPSGEGGRTSATGLLAAGLTPANLGGESVAMHRSSSALPLATGSPSVLAARAQPFGGGQRGVPGTSPGTTAPSLPPQMQLQLGGGPLHHPQASASQTGLTPSQVQYYQMQQIQRLSQNFQAFSRNQNEMSNPSGGGAPALDMATYAALFGGGSNSQLFQQQAGSSGGPAGINQQNLLQPPK